MTDKLIIFDTTLRDGEQSPGASMTREEKLRIARQLERMKVDVIEAGFAASSNGDFEAVKAIAAAVRDSTVCSLARANDRDISRAAEALAPAAQWMEQVPTALPSSYSMTMRLEANFSRSMPQWRQAGAAFTSSWAETAGATQAPFSAGVPLVPGQADGESHTSLMYEDKLLLKLRLMGRMRVRSTFQTDRARHSKSS